MHARPGANQPGEGLHLALGAKLVREADRGVQHEHGPDEGGVRGLAQGESDGRCREQHVDQWALELPQQDPPWRGRRRGLQTVGAEASQALRGLVARQTGERDAQLPRHGSRFESVPGGTLRRRYPLCIDHVVPGVDCPRPGRWGQVDRTHVLVPARTGTPPESTGKTTSSSRCGWWRCEKSNAVCYVKHPTNRYLSSSR
jgi:hypothetical protein